MPQPYRRQDKDQKVVTTPYGRGLVIRTRKDDDIQEVELLDWQTAKKKAPILYSSLTASPFKSVAPQVGDDVTCLYGRGRVLSINNDDNTCLVELSSWRLAGRSTVKCYLSIDSVYVVRKKTLYEMNAYEKVHYAQEIKETATALFAEKQHKQALENYDKAVMAVKYVQHDANSTNELRADLLLLMITCCNNAGTCCLLLQEWQDAIKFAKNALVLLDALYEKRGMRVHTILNREGTSDVKLFGEWKTKSLLIQARGLLERGDYDDSMEALKQAHHVISEYTQTNSLQDEAYQASYQTLHKQSMLVKRLRATCQQRRKQVKQKEKQRAQAMFASPSPKKTVKISESSDTNVSSESSVAASVGDEKPPTRPKVKRRVSFSEDTKPGTDEVLQDEEVVEEEPWYEEHFEAILLTGVIGLAAVTTLVLRSRK